MLRVYVLKFNGAMNTILFFLKKHFKNAFLVFSLMLSACATVPPVQEMSDARQALDAARTAGAEAHASKDLESAEALLQNAEHALQEGDYKQARKDAEAAQARAVAAQDKTLNK